LNEDLDKVLQCSRLSFIGIHNSTWALNDVH